MSSLTFNPPVIAHRGASAYAPENTMVAFTKAVQLGIKWVEFDVMEAACGHPVIFHDDLLDRTTNGRGLLEDYTYHQLRALDAGGWFDMKFAGEKIPSLQELIGFLARNHLSANVEIKALMRDEEPLIVKTLEIMSQFLATTPYPILFSSFSIDALYCLRKHSPTCLLGLLLHEKLPNWKDICTTLQCVSVHVNNDIITRDFVQEIKALGKAVLCYTVNSPHRAKELYAWGVDAVFSDVPDKILADL